jgi:hypothetical protein
MHKTEIGFIYCFTGSGFQENYFFGGTRFSVAKILQIVKFLKQNFLPLIKKFFCKN